MTQVLCTTGMHRCSDRQQSLEIYMCLQDTSPMNSTIPSLDGAMEYRASDAHTDVSDGPPDPPSMNGAKIYELLNSSLPTVKEEEHTGLSSGTASLRTSYSQLQMGASSNQVPGSAVPSGMLEHAVPENLPGGDGNQPSPQAPMESKFSAFGASYMTASPSQSVVLAATPSSGVCRETERAPSSSQPESTGQGVAPVPSMSGPPSGIVLGGISSMGPVSSMLSGPMSVTTAGPVSSTTAGVLRHEPEGFFAAAVFTVP